MGFRKEVQDALSYYVYGLVDPTTKEIFYIGKASGNNRAFDHLSAKNKDETEKEQRINQIRAKEEEPRVDILRFGLDDKSVLEVEAALIDAFGLEKLTNVVRGHNVERGRFTGDQVVRTFGAKNIELSSFSNPCIAFFVKRTYSPTLSPMELYDATRQFWGVGDRAREVNEDGSLIYSTALAVVDGVVVAAFDIKVWLEANSTMTSRRDLLRKEEGDGNNTKKWEFVGNMIPDHELTNARLIGDNGEKLNATQIGFMYLN